MDIAFESLIVVDVDMESTINVQDAELESDVVVDIEFASTIEET